MIALQLVVPLAAQAKKVTLASLNWPPYVAIDLPDEGASSKVVAAAFKAMGYDLEIRIVPWERAVSLATNDPSVQGYFPEYFSKANAETFLYSVPIGSGPLGFVEKKTAPIAWRSLDDLRSLTVGVVSGYVNTEEFDARVAKKEQKVDTAVDDATNVVKVARDRIPLAVIDPNVLDYLVYHDTKVIPYRGTVQFNSRLLDTKSLYVCFRNSPDGKNLLRILNEGVRKIDVDQVMKDYFAGLRK
jgi:polar amino acid transport system substrate-binding protein